jgi:hypothetical protein
MKMFLRISLLIMAVVSVYAQEYDLESDFSVVRSSDGNSVTITGYAGTKRVVRIPPQIRQIPVTIIGDGAFQNKNLTSVTIPNSVNYIGTSAFADNQLTSVTIPNNVTQIGGNAFKDNRLTSVTIPDSVTKIWGAAFQNNQLTSVTIGNSVTEIEGYVFMNNPITNITIGINVSLAGNSFPSGFYNFYNGLNKRAGTYTLNGNSWSEEW